MIRMVNVELGERSYAISIGSKVPVGTSFAGKSEVSVLLVSDSNVAPLHAAEIAGRLKENGACVSEAVVPAGEQSKSLACAEELYGEAINAGLDRKSFIVALGGGMVGDLAGFVAATFLRGVRLIHVPTTLLAMVDSSVGGKTAVNLPSGKNLVGVFHQPVEVAIDLSTLDTLPEREYLSGLAEVVKYGVIRDESFFSSVEERIDQLLNRDEETLQSVITRCCELKAEIVAMDEREAGVRAFLNFGHTCGHALEQVAGYGEWLHGEAVSLGMVYAAWVSAMQCGFPVESAERLSRLLERLGLPAGFKEKTAAPEWADIRSAMSTDKKTRGQVPMFVLAEQLGSVVAGLKVPEKLLEEAWRRLVV